jgi:hypothetical protein
VAPVAWAVSFVSCAVLLLAPQPAGAFVRTRSKGDLSKELFWKQSCAPLTIYLGDFPEKSGLSAEAIVKSVAAAAHAWSPDAVTCADGASHPFFEIVPTLAPPGAVPPAVGDDARNIVVFRTEAWTLDGKIEGKTALRAGALAYTHVTNHSDGHISDADILVNGTTIAWRNFDPGAAPSSDSTVREYDLQAALTHEFGHFLGFAHTCARPEELEVPPKDDKGDDVPLCGMADGAVIRAVMYVDTAEDDITKRTLSPDDAKAVCEVYAPRFDPKTCSADAPYDGCAVAPRRAGREPGLGEALAAALVAGLTAAWARRRARA